MEQYHDILLYFKFIFKETRNNICILAQSHFKSLQLETLNNLYIKLFLAPNLCFVPVKILASGSNFLILHTSN